jgi:hypothetical protein
METSDTAGQKKPAIMAREPDATMQPTLQDNQLMSKHRLLGFKPQLRLEWRGQDGQKETKQADHSASLGDSITSSTRIKFSYAHLAHCRAMAAFCRQRVAFENENDAFWIREAEAQSLLLLMAFCQRLGDVFMARAGKGPRKACSYRAEEGTADAPKLAFAA